MTSAPAYLYNVYSTPSKSKAPHAACNHMRGTWLSRDESSLHKVWTAIALHTSPGIAERIDPFTRLVRLGVNMDFSRTVRDEYGATEYAEEI
ncbi:hypothetical protein MPER_07748 [Moniliophthora perniciosa FA553]|nr:hypothetical protein MPER_07748 [Moniliophthora perniciosa FA553]